MGHLFLSDLELFWHSFKVGQTMVENMHFFQLSQNWVLKVDIGTHLRDKHGYLFLWHLEANFIIFGAIKIGTHFRDMHGDLYLWDLELF